MIDYMEVRIRSLAITQKLGYDVNKELPILDVSNVHRAKTEIALRICALHSIVACSYGFPVSSARAWVDQENLCDFLTDDEKRIISVRSDKSICEQFRVKVEAIWALAWAVHLVPILDFTCPCDNSLAKLLPNLKTLEPTDNIISVAQLRDSKEVIQHCDLAYCLHWAIVEMKMNNQMPPNQIPIHIIEQRRHALEWVLSKENWDDIYLDT